MAEKTQERKNATTREEEYRHKRRGLLIAQKPQEWKSTGGAKTTREKKYW